MSILNPGTRAFVNCREKESTVIRKHPETRVDIYIYTCDIINIQIYFGNVMFKLV